MTRNFLFLPRKKPLENRLEIMENPGEEKNWKNWKNMTANARCK